MEPGAADITLTRLLEVVSGFIGMLEQAAQRDDLDLTSLKAQLFDLMLEAIAAGATRLSDSDSVSAPLNDRACSVGDHLKRYQRSFVDIRLHLIELTEDWRCTVCGRNVARAAAIVSKSPVKAVIVCKACGATSQLTPRGEQRLEELFGSLESDTWNPAVNGFIV